jgi:excisionase family DNA binding protein
MLAALDAPNLCKAAPRRSNVAQTAVKEVMTPATNPGSKASVGRRLGLSTSQAARHLGVSLSTIRRWSDMGHLHGYRTPGGQRRFSVEQLDAFLTSLEQKSGF